APQELATTTESVKEQVATTPEPVKEQLISSTEAVTERFGLNDIGIGIDVGNDTENDNTPLRGADFPSAFGEKDIKESPKKSISARFAIFWKSYPKKRNKGQAERAFRKLNPDDNLLAAMVTAIEKAKQCRDWQKESGQFIPYPATWLNARGWEDEYEEFQQQKPPGKLPTTEELEKSWGTEESAKGRIW
ncbi:hypothetical protein M1N20_03000, partial [Dehalococcoidia bacterium]|nr:hypothetical protein [Dehalococcoidia bacterium]